MRLSDFFSKAEIVRDGQFMTLGHVQTSCAGTLVYCDTIFYVKAANKNDRVSCVVTTKSLSKDVAPKKGVVVAEYPRNCFYRIHHQLLSHNLMPSDIIYGVGKNCCIHPSAILSKKSKIGNNVTIEANVVIKDEVVIGDNARIDAGAVVGTDGLLYLKEDGDIYPVRHGGGVHVGRNVTILSQAVIARSIHPTLLTSIGDHSLIGIRSSIGHEVQIGKNCVISNNCVLARKAVIGDAAWIGSSAVIREYVTVGKGAMVMAGSIVIKDVPQNKKVSGHFAIDHQMNMMKFLKKERME